jgi:arabinofuranosyltransferase
VYAGVVGAHVVWRLAYYGALLPNTFHAKVGLSGSVLRRGLWYVASFFEPTSAALFLLLVPALAAGRNPRVRFVWSVTVVFLAAVAAEGGDAFPGFRLIVPALPGLYLLVQEGACLLVRWGGESRRPWLAPAARGTIAVLAAVHLLFVFVEVQVEARGANLMIGTMRPAGLALKREFPPGTTIATTPAGAVPYYSGFPAYDMLGLTDRHIASRDLPAIGTGLAGHEKGDGRYILERRPDLILLGGVTVVDGRPGPGQPIRLYGRSEHELAREPDFHRLYLADTIPLGDGRWLVFHRRRDFPPPRSSQPGPSPAR